MPSHSMSSLCRSASAVALVTVLSACGGGGGGGGEPNVKPSFVGTILKSVYDGVSDDLLTAGLGRTGLQSALAPSISNASDPSAAELRRLAIYNNYRAIVDITSGGGFGTLYGPNIDPAGRDTLGEGRIGGIEYLAYADDGSGRLNVTMLVQIPKSFDPNNACIITGTSSGSRGVYGAIGSSGEWGLKRGCAVAYTDKGTGNGVHDLASDTVSMIDGTRRSAAAAGSGSNFTAQITGAALAAFNAANPNRQAVKHAHSQQNPEKDWGRNTLQAIEFAFYVLNEEFGERANGAVVRQTIRSDNTIVIASSVSNGAGAAIAALEQDTAGLIDGLAVSEPNVQLPADATISIRRGSSVFAGTGKPIFDYFTIANLFQPCASLATAATGSPGAAFVTPAVATNRCAALKSKGLLSATTTQAQADEALGVLLAAGWQPESTVLHASHFAFATTPVALAYANSYGRFSVADNLCGFSYAATSATGAPAPIAAAALNSSFGTGNGVPPMSTIAIINNLNPTGPTRDAASASPSTGLLDFNTDGADCLRKLATGNDANAQRVQSGIREVLRTGNLQGRPAIIVHGRSDALVPVNFTSRPYFAVNRKVEGAASKLSYIEVTNAQHFDAFLGNAALPGYDTRYVPLHRYFNQALDLVYAHLKNGAPLPPSQVVRTTPRGGTAGQAPAIGAANVPPISLAPASGDLITYSNNTVVVPD